MKKLYCVIYGRYRKFRKPKVKKIFKEEESIEILNIPCLIKNMKLLYKYGWRKHQLRI